MLQEFLKEWALLFAVVIWEANITDVAMQKCFEDFDSDNTKGLDGFWRNKWHFFSRRKHLQRWLWNNQEKIVNLFSVSSKDTIIAWTDVVMQSLLLTSNTINKLMWNFHFDLWK